jgi:redox-sensitive bicupin YhaK (pirin superfamily)
MCPVLRHFLTACVLIDSIIDARPASLGNGFDVRCILPYRLRRMLGPFMFMDYAGPVNWTPAQVSDMDVLSHPHIGLSTVSYLFDGQVTHRDSLVVQQIIRPVEVNWMKAGRGIAHSERSEDPATQEAKADWKAGRIALPPNDNTEFVPLPITNSRPAGSGTPPPQLLS